jgi:hypothetical protein
MLLIAASFARGQEIAPTDLELVKKQMLEMQQSIQQMQTQHQSEIDALKKQIAGQQVLIDSLQKSSTASAMPPLPAGKETAKQAQQSPQLFPTTDESLVPSQAPTVPTGAAAPGAATFPTTDASVVTAGPAMGTAPITIAGGGKSYLNISFDGVYTAAASTASDLDQIEVGDHDPLHRGFNARNNEIALDGAVDPFFEGFANIVLKLDNQNETSIELEEAFMQTTTLPFGLQLKGGQFFVPFGRINPTHPHTWDFVDAPLVHGRLLGPDGLRGVGAQVAWVMPLPWYSQLLLALQNGEGGTGYSFRNTNGGTFYGRDTIDRQLSGVQDLLFVPRWESSFDFSDTRTLLFGVSGAFAPNDTGTNTHTQIYGVDTFYKWKPSNAEGGWPFVKWQSEAMYRRFEAGQDLSQLLPSETFHDWGAYSQLVWGFSKGWTTGLRGDYLHMEDSSITNDPDRQSRWRLSAELTWYPSEFSKIRLQYNHDFLEQMHFLDAREADSIFLQFEFALGAHGAHKY